ncbi:asparagine synthase (glutamine-hydrolyzing) [Roseivirga sp. 4D4]|uniref:asparagine synthase (glutamine-hydrolyzing) n=1 Tax=Roseivirga sp. 4D4 TaxID=1889784 RepID=UPI0008534AE5|nr:asparagine synthase (glutamine-hydrolyzing) [Roseivirga sp. 4D4]OEK01642.1 asparagine synthase (glutamine-hydrolyzing) [Roseivirga sp. 4D4]
MCGILGFYDTQRGLNKVLFEKSLELMEFRGPDDSGVEIYNDQIYLGQKRLAIIDLTSAGHQPMESHDGKLSIVFNGEIYNYQALRNQLINDGQVFFSNSDTEVLLLGYKEWGLPLLLNKIKGMFSFAIYDKELGVIIGARDRFGIKPFYYSNDFQGFGFSSNLKSLKVLLEREENTLNENALLDFLNLGYVPNPDCIWESCNKLPPAHFFEYSLETTILKVERYWELAISSVKLPFNKACEQFESMLDRSIDDHLVADVPIGLFLSGGYDSSTVLAKMSSRVKQINTFSIGFKDSDRSEHLVAEELASKFKTNHQTLLVDKDDDVLGDLHELVRFLDEPYAISSMIPYYLVSKLASNQNKVVMVGDGGDELLGGYNWHYHIARTEREFWLKKQARFLKGGGYRNYLSKRYAKVMGTLSKEDLSVFKPRIEKKIKQRQLDFYKGNMRDTGSMVKDMQYLDMATFLPEPALTRADRMSMAHSIEVRVPFLDHELFEFTFGLHPSSYFDRHAKKPFLNKILNDTPASFILNLPKRGFSFQFLDWFKSKESQQLIEEQLVRLPNIFNHSFSYDNLSPLMNFKLLVLSIWIKQNL